MRKVLIISFLFLVGLNGFGQYKILDAPFIPEKLAIYQPAPMDIDWAIRNKFWYSPKKDSSEADVYLKNYPFYNLSYLYGEPEYARVRTFRTIYKDSNLQFSDNTPLLSWDKIDSLWHINTGNEEKIISIDNLYQFEPHLPWWIRKLLNLNIKEIQNNPKPYTREKTALSHFDGAVKRHIEKNQVKIDKDGVLIKAQDFQPDKFETIPLTKLIYSSHSSGYITPYFDENFTKRMTNAEFINKVDSFKQYNGIRLKEDYFIDPASGKFVSTIIGFGLIDRKGKDLCWFYYPELRYAIENKGTIVDNIIMDYMYVFDEHNYQSSIDTIFGLAAAQGAFKSDDSYLLKLMPLAKLKIHNEEISRVTADGAQIFKRNGNLGEVSIEYKNDIPNGKYKSYYNNGGTYSIGEFKNGKCEGEFKFFYDNGTLKASRFYSNGVLHGWQKSYYENGEVYAIYEVDNDVIQSLERYYDDKKLMEKGRFKKGLFYGDWEYHIKCSDEFFKLLDKYRYEKSEELNYKNDMIHIKVNYTHESREDCPFLYYGKEYEPICPKTTVIK